MEAKSSHGAAWRACATRRAWTRCRTALVEARTATVARRCAASAGSPRRRSRHQSARADAARHGRSRRRALPSRACGDETGDRVEDEEADALVHQQLLDARAQRRPQVLDRLDLQHEDVLEQLLLRRAEPRGFAAKAPARRSRSRASGTPARRVGVEHAPRRRPARRGSAAGATVAPSCGASCVLPTPASPAVGDRATLEPAAFAARRCPRTPSTACACATRPRGGGRRARVHRPTPWRRRRRRRRLAACSAASPPEPSSRARGHRPPRRLGGRSTSRSPLPLIMVRRCRDAHAPARPRSGRRLAFFSCPPRRGDDRSARRTSRPLLSAPTPVPPPRAAVTASHAQKKRLAADKKMMNNVTKRGTIGDPSQEVCTAAAGPAICFICSDAAAPR